MKFDVKEILKGIEKAGFYETWEKYSGLIPKTGRLRRPARSRSHPVQEIIQKIRRALLDLGFEEVILPIMVDVSEVFRQYGPEAPVILDRVYFLAGLPRPDIGLDSEKEKLLMEELGISNPATLRTIFREYRKGEIDADELIEVLKRRLGLDDKGALKLLALFEPFFNLRPEPSSLTLRSHMTASWFRAISEILEYRDPPIALFSIDWVFRREQREDSSHLRNYHSASLVIVDEGLGEEAALSLVKDLMGRIGFENVEIKPRPDTARYYAMGKEWEVFADFKGARYEIATGGFYNPISLARYGIPYPVFNLGIGVERVVQMLTSEKDIRRLLFSYRYFEPSDEEIASMLGPIERPVTEWGTRLAKLLVEEVEKEKDRVGPFEKKVFSGQGLEVYILEPDRGKKLAGPATFNRIYVRDGNIVSSLSPIDGAFVSRYVDLLALRFAAMAEKGVEGHIKVRWAAGPSDVNLRIPEKLFKWMRERGKAVEISGPVFLDVLIRRKG